MCKNKCTGATSSKGNKGDPGADGDNGLFGGYSSNWIFNNGTSNNPSTTTLRLNNASPASATAIYVHKNNEGSVDLAAFLLSFSNSSSYGWVRLFEEFDSSKFAYYQVTGVSVSGDVTTLTVTYVDGNGTFTNAGSVVLSFVPKGANGTGSAVRTFTDYNTPFAVSGSDTSQDVTGATGTATVAGTYMIIYEADVAVDNVAAFNMLYRLHKSGGVAINNDNVVSVAGGIALQTKIVCTAVATLTAGQTVYLNVGTATAVGANINSRSIIMHLLSS